MQQTLTMPDNQGSQSRDVHMSDLEVKTVAEQRPFGLTAVYACLKTAQQQQQQQQHALAALLLTCSVK
jgi:hypothetical protein